MVRQPTARLQLSAQRFSLRRLEDALRGTPPGADQRPARGPSPVAGGLVAVLLTVGCAVAGWVRPQTLDDAPIVLDGGSGALYVRVGERLHPVLNLASARLIAAIDAAPQRRPAAVIARAQRGPLLGIPGAPQVLGPAATAPSPWAICDHPAATTVLTGVEPATAGRLDPQQAVPVVSASSGVTYLLYRGQRVATDTAGAELPAGTTPRPVSAALLNTIPEAPAMPGPPDRTVVLPPTAMLCVHWHPDDPAGLVLSAQAGLPLPPGAEAVPLAQADAAGPGVDAVYLPAGHSAYVCAAGGPRCGERYLISDTGTRFAVADDSAARSLGLPAQPSPAPWPMLAALPAGPRLDRDDALLSWDALPGSPACGR